MLAELLGNRRKFLDWGNLQISLLDETHEIVHFLGSNWLVEELILSLTVGSGRGIREDAVVFGARILFLSFGDLDFGSGLEIFSAADGTSHFEFLNYQQK